MYSNPKRPEIDHHTIKLIVGVIAISLAALTSIFSETPLQSISASYHEGGWSRDIFVGFLFAISAFLLAYNGKSKEEMVLSKVAAIAAMGVALFPCQCGDHPVIIPHVHGVSTTAMFVILAIFCFIFFRRAYAKGHAQAMVRAFIYAFSGVTLAASILVIAFDSLLSDPLSAPESRLTFYGEAAGLIAFGIAWLTASRILPIITSKEERLRLLP